MLCNLSGMLAINWIEALDLVLHTFITEVKVCSLKDCKLFYCKII